MYAIATRLSAPMMSPSIRSPMNGVVTTVCDLVVHTTDASDLLVKWCNAADQNALDHLASKQLVKSFRVLLVVGKWKWVNLAVATQCSGLQNDGHCVTELIA